MPALLELHDLTKSFGAVPALKSVSFDLHPGEVHALLGENGAGKSTLIKIIAGAHPPDSGRMILDGQPVARLSPALAHRLGIACIYQQPALFPDLTVTENIALRLDPPVALRRVRWARHRGRAVTLLAQIGAHMSPDAKVAQLSMPEQQLVEIACAVAAGARIVIMDEPTASLTQRETDLLLRTVRDLRSRGVGVIYISHRLEEIFAIADRVTVLRDGESVCTRSLQPSPESSPVTRSELIRSMVGRELSQVYPPPSGPPGDILLSLENFGCSEAGVHGVTLEIHAGEVVGLAGLVGAGRTELARALFGISPADSGTVRLSGQLVHIDSPRSAIDQGIAYVPEDRRRHGIILDLPISSNMTLAVHQRIFPGGWLRFGAENGLTLDYIRRLSIRTSGANARGGSLSGGNQQKVSLARWLATRPRLLILDEPTQGVDVGAKAEIHRIIRQLAADGMAVLMISSDLPEIVGMSQRIAVMRGGTVVGILPGGSDAHQVIELALGQKPGAAAA